MISIEPSTSFPKWSRGDVDENRDFISLSHEMEVPMAEIARHVGVCGLAVVKAIRKIESAD
jgi:predicted regulator of amino acid metabolism with ACT domain